MKRSGEERLDQIIDALNQERRPPRPDDRETAELLALVLALRQLREPAAPSPGFPWRLRKAVSGRGTRGSRLVPVAAALVAGLLLLAVFGSWPQPWRQDVVHAMEQAVARLQSYHGILEVRALNADGEEWLVRRLEIWSDDRRYATRDDDGVMTVNDGERRWQVRPREQLVVVLPLLPDPRGFDLEDEARQAMAYPHRVVGEDEVAGRRAVHVEIAPPGGLPYDLWIDARTDLPLRLRTAMINALQTEYTFVAFEENAAIDPAIFQFRVPEGYRVVEGDPGQLVNTPSEAAAVAGFTPVVPAGAGAPTRILASRGRVVLEYGDTLVVETPAAGPLEPERHGALGRYGDAWVEVLPDRLRWQQDGLEIRVEGPRRVELAREIAPGIELPEPGQAPQPTPEVEVPVDLEQARREQQSVDGGHSPWMLDPQQVAHAFLLSGKAGGGEFPPVDELEVIANDGVHAVVAVPSGPVARVYVERLVRQDATGIWSVTGYDRR